MTKENLTTQDNGETSDTPQSGKEPIKTKPKGLIRVGGIGTLTVLTAAIYFGIAPAIKFGIQTSMESAFGAQADIESVEVQWQPFVVDIKGVQQTDPNAPHQDIFALQQAKINVRPWDFLLGRTIINDLQITGLKFHQPRKVPGQVFNTAEAVADSEQSAVTTEHSDAGVDEAQGGLEIPTSEELLGNTQLQTELKAKNFQSVWQQESAAIKSMYANLPDKSAAKNYDKQWQEIEDSEIKSLDDLKQLREKVSLLKAQINADRKKIKAAKGQYKLSKQNVDLAYQELKAAPGQDWQTIKQKLPIDDPNAVAISRVLFGDDIAGYLDQGIAYYETAKPYIDKYKANKAAQQTEIKPKEGEYFSFELNEPLPAWLIVNADVSLSLEQKSWQLNATDITADSTVRDKPGRYQLTQFTQPSQKFVLDGQFFAVPNKGLTTQGTWQLNNATLKNYDVAKDDNFTLALASASIDGSGNYAFDKELSSQHEFRFTQSRFEGDGQGKFASVLLDSLTKIDQFNIELVAKGKLLKPQVSLDSNLDDKVSKSFSRAFSQELKKVEQQTKAELQSKVTNYIEEKAPQLVKLQNLERDIDQWESSLKDKAEEKLDKLIGDKKQALEDKLKKQAEDKIKDKIDEDEIKDKLKDKLKDFKCCE